MNNHYEIGDRDGKPYIRYRATAGDKFRAPSERAYWTTGQFVRFVNHQCLRSRKLNAERLPARGPAIIAVTHLSHLEPFVLSVNTRAAIHWMTRLEFYRNKWARRLLQRHLTFPVNRAGCCLGTMRYALRLLAAGQVVGIFPEGGVAVGDQAAIRGGPVKPGACWLAQRSGAPLLPVVVVGTHTLNRVPPWLPFRRGRIWLAVGTPLQAGGERKSPRAQRAAMNRQLSEAFQSLYRDLLEHTDLKADFAP